MNGKFEISNNLDILRLWFEENITPERFDVVALSGEDKIFQPIYKVI